MMSADNPSAMTKPIEIYVDADACPVKAEVYRVAERHGLKVYVVSNSPIAVPREPWIERVVVGAGMDVADNWIAERAGPGDIVITADVPLANMFGYVGTLRSMTQGRAAYSMEFHHYAPVPTALAEELVEKNRR